MYIRGMLGYTETIPGKYELNGDTIVFLERPYDNDFIPDTMLIDRSAGILRKRLNDGNFDYGEQWLGGFKITLDETGNGSDHPAEHKSQQEP